MAEFGRLVEVVGAFRGLAGVAGLLQLLARGANLLDHAFLSLPLQPHGVGVRAQIGQLPAQRLEALEARLVLLLLERGLLDLQAHDLARDLVEFGRHGVHLRADRGAGLVDEVDGLVRQEAVGDVAVGEHGGGDDGGVLDADVVIELEAVAQAAEDGDRVLDARGVDGDGLEAAFEGGVLLHVLAVFVEGRGADAVEFAAGEHGLEHVGGVGRALGPARADDRVDLVDEEDDGAFGGLDLVEDGLEALLELAAVLGAGHERGHVERVDGAALEVLGDVAADDALGEALDDGGLADAGLADEHGVVLGLAREDARDGADFGIAADDGVELVLARHLDEVDAVLLERLVLGLRRIGGHALAAADLLEGREHGRRVETGLLQDPGRFGALVAVEHGQEQVFDRDILVLEPPGVVLGFDHQGLELLGHVDLPGLGGLAADARHAVEGGLHGGNDGGRIRARLLENARNEPVLLRQQGVEQMRHVDRLVAVSQCRLLGGLNGFLRLLGEFLVHGQSPLWACFLHNPCQPFSPAPTLRFRHNSSHSRSFCAIPSRRLFSEWGVGRRA